MPATAADREMVLRAFGATEATRVDTPPPATPVVEPLPLIGNVWRKDAAQDAKSKEKEKETTPEVVDLSSASDTPPKKAPEKKPEEVSENKVEYDKKAATLASAAIRKTAQTPGDGGVLPSAADTKPDKQSPQQKPEGKPSKPDEKSPVTTAADSELAPEAPGGDIPILGATGGAVLGGLEKLLGGIGWEGGQQKLQQWGQSPTARNIAGGTTATLAAIISALVARKAFGGGEQELEIEAGMKLHLVKKSLMGQSAPAPKGVDGKNEQYNIPTRSGVVTTHRNEIFGDLNKWSLGK